MKPKILIIIPCYNEEASLPRLIADLNAIKKDNWDIVVVNDCSKDNTAEVAKGLGVRVLDLPINLGIGGAMQTGYRYAELQNYDIAIQVDGDGQHLPSELPALISHHQQTGANVVIGSRFKKKTAYKSSISRRSGIFYFQVLSKVLLGQAVHDCTSGFRLFDRSALKLAASTYPDEYPEPDSLILFSKQGLTIAEIPVLMQARQGGQSSIGSFSGIYYMIKVTLAMLFSYIRYSNKH